jgi:hypothetical protein
MGRKLACTGEVFYLEILKGTVHLGVLDVGGREILILIMCEDVD